jgi:hypothetical protein
MRIPRAALRAAPPRAFPLPSLADCRSPKVLFFAARGGLKLPVILCLGSRSLWIGSSAEFRPSISVLLCDYSLSSSRATSGGTQNPPLASPAVQAPLGEAVKGSSALRLPSVRIPVRYVSDSYPGLHSAPQAPSTSSPAATRPRS